MRAVVLVGGFGTRLRPLTLNTPKPLLPVGHRPILELVVANLGRAGVTEVVLALGFNPDAFRAAYPDGTCAGVRLAYAVEPEPLDTAGAIRFAALAAGIDDTFVVVNGDVLTDLDVRRLVALHRERAAEGTIHLTPVDDPSAFGVVPTDALGRVEAFIEKPPRHEAPTNLINAGTYVLEASVLDRIAPEGKVSIERVTFPAMVGDGVLFALATDDYWLDTGQPHTYRQANLDLVERRRDGLDAAAIHPSATVEQSAQVWRSLVGEGAEIGPGACLDGAVLLPAARVGAGAVVTESILGVGAQVGEGAELTDVVLGDGVAVEPHARLEHVRVPEPA